MLGKVNIEDMCLLCYLRGWVFFPKAKYLIADGCKFFWLHYGNAVNENPMLFNPEATLASRKNQLSRLVKKLRGAGLLETKMVKGNLYFRMTELALALTKSGGPIAAIIKGVTPSGRDVAVIPENDDAITSGHDDSPPAIYIEQGTSEQKINESPPLSPSTGNVLAVMDFWKSFPGLTKAIEMTRGRERNLRKRLADPRWCDRWHQAVKRLAASPFATGGGPNGWRADFDWFLKPDSLTKILEGKYDDRLRSEFEYLDQRYER